MKEKELINKCLVDFYNYCLGYKGDVRYAGLLTPLVYMYSNAKTVLEKKPPLNQSELDDIFKDPRLMLPEDMSKVIGEYLGSIQNAGRKKRRKSKKNAKKRTYKKRTYKKYG